MRKELDFDVRRGAPAVSRAGANGEWLSEGWGDEVSRMRGAAIRRDASSQRDVCARYNADLPKSIEKTGRMDDDQASGEPRGWISRYAWGDDYHDVLRKKLDALAAAMRERFADEPFEARTYADTGPVQERVLAKYAGLGWLGKNTLLLNQVMGSWFFLGTILTTLALLRR
jgi:epoxyqueuosine reductase